MKLGQDRDSLLLEPAGPNIRFVMGGRCASHLSEGKGSYGPFRMLSGVDEEEVLAELGHQSL